ncbi:OLC1v1006344C1 [Oldenlandia corymbosa var. corymbosa]|uniref:OLC1v1006344C1 n=1 Tax=Oldenlandia corymbosa var. corymbosa TaxID=529605 RepID=A0AAV1DGS2_OLDCO|nr:OLC1v1006344C1 [Oldenlandia corymbosa var. corymbosa]
MNAASNSANEFIPENAGGFGSDSDEDTPEFYQPISAIADDDDEESNFPDSNPDDDDANEHDHRLHPFPHDLPNGYSLHPVENGVSLDLTDDEEEDEDSGEEEERVREEESIRRAFREDDSRRNAPLPPENAVRVMEAMRGVSFGGLPPDWVDRIPEDQWIDQLRRIRRPSTAQE